MSTPYAFAFSPIEFARLLSGLLFSVGCLPIINAIAEPVSVQDVLDFYNPNHPTSNYYGNPGSELLLKSGDTYYGVAAAGHFSALYEMNLHGAGKMLYKFKYKQAYNINPVLTLLPDGTIFGTAETGGEYGNGSVFRFDTNHELKIVHSFLLQGSDGNSPFAGLLLAADGYLYGVTTSGGGPRGTDGGTVYRINPVGNTFEVLHLFPSGSNGDHEGNSPAGDLVQASDGTIYGTTSGGGTERAGTVFHLTPDGNVTTVASFASDASVGCAPNSGLTDGHDGWFYGTTQACGEFGQGTIYRFNRGGTLQKLYDLTTNDYNVAIANSPRLRLGSDGALYGVFVRGGGGDDGYGLAYRLDKTGKLTPLHTFTEAEGCLAVAGLVQVAPNQFMGPLQTCGPHPPSGADYVMRVH